jgi:hypothetical protein
MLQQTFDKGLRGWDIVDTMFNIIVRLVWRSRETVLRPAQRILPQVPRIKSSSSRSTIQEEDPSFYDALLTKGADWIRTWSKDLAKRTKVWEKDVTPRLDPLLPPKIRQSIEEWQVVHEETRMIPIFEALQSSLFNFLVSATGPTNNKTYHQKLLPLLADELAHYRGQLRPALQVVTPVARLYHQIVEVIHSCPELAHARFWLDIPEAPDAPMEVDQSLYTNQLVRKDRGERMSVFNSSFLAFLKRISKADCLGIMTNRLLESSIEDNAPEFPAYKLHLVFARELARFSRQAKIVAHQLSVINHSSDFSKWPVVENDWYTIEDQSDDITVPLPFCSIDDLILHYQDQQVQDAIEEERGNEELVRQALDEGFGLLPVPERSDEQDGGNDLSNSAPPEDEDDEVEGNQDADDRGRLVAQTRGKRGRSDEEGVGDVHDKDGESCRDELNRIKRQKVSGAGGSHGPSDRAN